MVLYGAKSTILLFDEEKGACHGRLGGSDVALLAVFIEELVELLFLRWRKGVRLASLGYEVVLQIDGVVPGVMLGKSLCFSI